MQICDKKNHNILTVKGKKCFHKHKYGQKLTNKAKIHFMGSV